MSDQKCILAIDQSTSSTKAILFDEMGGLVMRCDEPHQQIHPQPDWVEHDPEEIYANTLLAIQNVLGNSGIDQDQVAALAVTNQRETALIWDRKTGKPVYNAIVWQCQRGVTTCQALRDQGWEEKVRSKTGLLIDPYFSATKLKWILDHVKGVKEKAQAGDLIFGTIDTWLIHRLTGGKVHATDPSNACRTMLYNIYDLQWDAELFDLMGIPVCMAPAVKQGNETFGYTTCGHLFDREIPITGVMGDSHAALFGQNCFEQGMAKVTYGTGSSVMMNIGLQPIRSPEGLVTSIGWGYGDDIVYVFEGNIHCTGATIKWLVEDLELIPNAQAAEEIAASVADNQGVYLVPAFAGLGAPYWDNQARACLCGMSLSTQKAHVVRAGLEAIAFQIKDVLDLMSEGSGVPLRELRVDGGPTRNNLLMQFQVDMLRGKLVRTTAEEISAYGVALMAGLTVGLWQDFAEVKALRKVDRVFSFKMDQQTAEKHYNGWRQAVASVINTGKQSKIILDKKLGKDHE